MIYRFSLFLFVLCLSQVSLADKPDAATRLQSQLAPLTEMSGRFAQAIYDDRGELLQRSEGAFAVKRPSRLRWHTQEPYEHLVITDGETLLRWDPDLEQLNRESVSDDMMATPAMILGEGGHRLRDRYRIRAVKQTGGERFVLTPRADSPFSELSILFEGQRLTGIEMLDSLGQRTEISISELDTESELPSETFELPTEAQR